MYINRCVTVILVMGSVFVSGARGEDSLGPRMVLSTTEIDLGSVEPVDGLERVVEVRNVGTGALEVDPIKALCTCVEVSTAALVVEPGATAFLPIRAMLATYPANEVKGKVRLHTNDTDQPEVDITVRAEIRQEYAIEPAELDFGTVAPGRPATRSFVVQQNGLEPLRIERVAASRGLKAVLEEVLPKEKEAEEQPKCYKVVVTLDPETLKGNFRGSVTVFTNCARLPDAELKVTAKAARLDYGVKPKVLAFGAAAPGEVLGTFIVEGEGIAVAEAQSDNTGLVLAVSEVEAGKQYHVKAIAGEDAAAGRFLSKVTLRIEDGWRSEEVNVRVFGQVEQRGGS